MILKTNLTLLPRLARLARDMTFQIQEIKKTEAEFPLQLAPLKSGPDKLFVRGNVSALVEEPLVAVVGTRKITQYGRTVIQRMVPIWSRSGITIVSGLALGTDALAHQATLDAGGTTVAVLGSGIDDSSITPRTNYSLGQNILEQQGAIVSEHEPGTAAQPHHFPIRNRIIAGLSQALVVTEGTMKSGTLITAKCMLEYGREVFAVPGPITVESSSAPNWLISQGAHPLLRPEDLVEKLGLEIASKSHDKTTGKTSPNAKLILQYLKSSPATADDMVERTKLDTSTVLGALSELELSEIISRTGDLYTVIN